MTAAFDIITAGGGLGGASLAKAIAEAGKRVLVVERETVFKDRVRGEGLMPWGVAEAKAVGIYQELLSSGARELPSWRTAFGARHVEHRNLVETTPMAMPVLAFSHPAAQETLLAAAAAAGAIVRRGATVRGVTPGDMPRVTVEAEGRAHEVEARLIVGVDGRNSTLRRAAGLRPERDADRLRVAGVLLEGTRAVPEGTVLQVFGLGSGRGAILFPLGEGRVRCYFVCGQDMRFQGEKDVGRLIDECVAVGVAKEMFHGARAAGPLATFEGAESWVKHPYKDGVALVGDAAASSDPTWGQGLSLTLRDVRVLRDALVGTDDWNAAGHSYAAEHDRYFTISHAAAGWYTELFYGTGPEADARRARALPRFAKESDRIPDALIGGPETTEATDATRRRFFAED